VTIYVDTLCRRELGRTKWWCHLFTTGSIDDLHKFAEMIGLKRNWFQSLASLPHYDVSRSKRAQAVRCGANQVDRRTATGLMRDAQQRAGDREGVR